MNLAEKILRAKKDLDDVYEAGKKDENMHFWLNYTGLTGESADWRRKFANTKWTDEIFNPPFTKIKATLYAGSMFQNSGIKDALQKIEEIDISATDYATSTMTNFGASAQCRYFPKIIFPTNASLTQAFNYCQYLIEIKKMVVSEKNTFSNTFNMCTALEKISIEGVIGQSISFKDCPLDKASITSVVEHLSSAATGQTATFKKAAKEAVFTEDEWESLTDTKKNWTISLV